MNLGWPGQIRLQCRSAWDPNAIIASSEEVRSAMGATVMIWLDEIRWDPSLRSSE